MSTDTHQVCERKVRSTHRPRLAYDASERVACRSPLADDDHHDCVSAWTQGPGPRGQRRIARLRHHHAGIHCPFIHVDRKSGEDNQQSCIGHSSSCQARLTSSKTHVVKDIHRNQNPLWERSWSLLVRTGARLWLSIQPTLVGTLPSHWNNRQDAE